MQLLDFHNAAVNQNQTDEVVRLGLVRDDISTYHSLILGRLQLRSPMRGSVAVLWRAPNSCKAEDWASRDLQGRPLHRYFMVSRAIVHLLPVAQILINRPDHLISDLRGFSESRRKIAQNLFKLFPVAVHVPKRDSFAPVLYRD